MGMQVGSGGAGVNKRARVATWCPFWDADRASDASSHQTCGTLQLSAYMYGYVPWPLARDCHNPGPSTVIHKACTLLQSCTHASTPLSNVHSYITLFTRLTIRQLFSLRLGSTCIHVQLHRYKKHLPLACTYCPCMQSLQQSHLRICLPYRTWDSLIITLPWCDHRLLAVGGIVSTV